jgi:hypothetical protein
VKVGISLIMVAILAIAISRKVRLSSRYDRAPRTLSPWNSMDKGIDPTEDQS